MNISSKFRVGNNLYVVENAPLISVIIPVYNVENIKISARIPLERRNLKLDAALLLLKCHAYPIIYMIIIAANKLKINLVVHQIRI